MFGLGVAVEVEEGDEEGSGEEMLPRVVTPLLFFETANAVEKWLKLAVVTSARANIDTATTMKAVELLFLYDIKKL